MKITSAIIATSAFIGLSSAACEGYATVNAITYPLNVCAFVVDQGTKYTCDGDTLKQTLYSDATCETEVTTIDVTTATAKECSSVANCDYIHYYTWDSAADTCGTSTAQFEAGGPITSAFMFSGIDAGIFTVNSCVSATNSKTEVSSCTAGFSGDALTASTFAGTDCSGTSQSITTAFQSSTDAPVDGSCNMIVRCSSNGVLADSGANSLIAHGMITIALTIVSIIFI